MLKAAFDILKDGSIVLSEEQEPINFRDRFHGALNETSLFHPSEFVPYKPGTDFIFNLTAYAPGSEPTRDFRAGVRIYNRERVIEKFVRVVGERFWHPRWRKGFDPAKAVSAADRKRHFVRWELSEPSLLQTLPLRYEYTYGGTLAKGTDAKEQPILEAYEHNPVGIGWIDPEWTDHSQAVPAPQIEDPADPVAKPGVHYPPAGLGPIPPVWLPRRPLAGTYDQDWIDHVWPKWPKDYRFEYHHSAAAGLVITPYIQGDFKIELYNTHKDSDVFTISYKDIGPYMSIGYRDGQWDHVSMDMDTVMVSEDNSQMFLIWRAMFDVNETDVIQVRCLSDKDSPSPEMLRRGLRKNGKPEDVASIRKHEVQG